jgi:hypothetical protein
MTKISKLEIKNNKYVVVKLNTDYTLIFQFNFLLYIFLVNDSSINLILKTFNYSNYQNILQFINNSLSIHDINDFYNFDIKEIYKLLFWEI